MTTNKSDDVFGEDKRVAAGNKSLEATSLTLKPVENTSSAFARLDLETIETSHGYIAFDTAVTEDVIQVIPTQLDYPTFVSNQKDTH